METITAIEKFTFLASVSIVGLIHLFILMNKFGNKINTNQFVKICSMVFLLLCSIFIKIKGTVYFKNKKNVIAKIAEAGILKIT